ncbi:MAG: class I SAM-dependent methyltransferase [Gemmatimonadota bacterium]
MSDPEDGFYDRLAADYEALIRTLVPRYDDLLYWTLDVVLAADPDSVIELGPGVGGLSATLLDRLPEVSLTAVEASAGMALRVEERLRRHGARARVIHGDARSHEPEAPVDVVVSTLVLHNLGPGDRQALLPHIRSWLSADGIFVWGEFLRFEDAAVETRVRSYRERFSAERGCPAEVSRQNYAKETKHDFPPTAREVFEAARQAGFGSTDLVWAHDAFGLFRLCR